SDTREYWPDAERVVVARQDLRRVVAALSKLPKRTLFALSLYSVEGRTYREIGVALGLSHVAAFRLVAQALAKAAAALDG
ncbi:MAG: sigma factor-like helix-turn-helix DNA-binding protein, partial [Pseudomonadota bacterium]